MRSIDIDKANIYNKNFLTDAPHPSEVQGLTDLFNFKLIIN